MYKEKKKKMLFFCALWESTWNKDINKDTGDIYSLKY